MNAEGVFELSTHQPNPHVCHTCPHFYSHRNSRHDARDGGTFCLLLWRDRRNIYYTQTIVALIAPDLGLAPGDASLIVSLTQIGYALGLLFVLPLGGDHFG